MTRCLLVPGRGVPRPEHWLSRWARAHAEYRWAPHPPGPPFVLQDRVAALDEAVTADDEPAILIAHSAGCVTAVAWAERHVGVGSVRSAQPASHRRTSIRSGPRVRRIPTI